MSPHLSSTCRCGRRMHFPKYARFGYIWKCRRCGMRYVLSDIGKPLKWRSSKRPPVSTHPVPMVRSNNDVQVNEEQAVKALKRFTQIMLTGLAGICRRLSNQIR